jgi:hypothetical protein
MSAIHKRCYYAMRQEFKLLSKIIAEYLPPEYPYAVYGADRIIKSLDFDNRVDIFTCCRPKYILNGTKSDVSTDSIANCTDKSTTS